MNPSQQETPKNLIPSEEQASGTMAHPVTTTEGNISGQPSLLNVNTNMPDRDLQVAKSLVKLLCYDGHRKVLSNPAAILETKDRNFWLTGIYVNAYENEAQLQVSFEAIKNAARSNLLVLEQKQSINSKEQEQTQTRIATIQALIEDRNFWEDLASANSGKAFSRHPAFIQHFHDFLQTSNLSEKTATDKKSFMALLLGSKPNDPLIKPYVKALQKEIQTLEKKVTALASNVKEIEQQDAVMRKQIAAQRICAEDLSAEVIKQLTKILDQGTKSANTSLDRVISIGKIAEVQEQDFSTIRNAIQALREMQGLIKTSSSEYFLEAESDLNDLKKRVETINTDKNLSAERLTEIKLEIQSCSDATTAKNLAQESKKLEEQIKKITTDTLPSLLKREEDYNANFALANAYEKSRLALANDALAQAEILQFAQELFGEQFGQIVIESQDLFFKQLVASIDAANKFLRQRVHQQVSYWIDLSSLESINNYDDRKAYQQFLDAGGKAALFQLKADAYGYCTKGEGQVSAEYRWPNGDNHNHKENAPVESLLPKTFIDRFYQRYTYDRTFQVWSKDSSDRWLPIANHVELSALSYALIVFSDSARWHASYMKDCDQYGASININAYIDSADKTAIEAN